MTWRLTDRQPTPPKAGLKIDVFVPTYNEPTEIVRKTVLAAKHMEYPHDTWLLDDGRRPEMAELARRLGVHYIARDNNLHAKAGNLNNALKHATGDFIAIFDADHAPQKNFLLRTMGFFSDCKVAFIQTPQDFFNLDSFQHRWQKKTKRLWTEQSLFFKVIQCGKDYWNASFFCGSCAVVRRSALDAVGGFATETITEDLHTSIKFHKAGFRSVYLPESLAFGIAPATIAPFLHQRIRWGQGAMQVLRKENIFFTSQLSIAQRLNYLASILTYFDGWQKGLFYIAPVIVLLTGILPIEASGPEFVLHFLPYYICSLWMFEEIGRGYGGILYIEQYNFARFAAFAWATLGLFVGNLQFKVTSKVRDKAQNFSYLLLPQFAVLLLNGFAIPAGLLLSSRSTHLPQHALVFNIFWATMNLALAIALISYTQKTQAFLRSEYRFPIPLPIRLCDGYQASMATIDNISPSGCRIYGRLPSLAKQWGVITGEISLPSGPLAIQALVVSQAQTLSSSDDFVRAVGCQFIWEDQESRDQLELFLYGTDLQCRLLELKEQNITPMQWPKKTVPNSARNENWATFSFRQGQDKALKFGLIALPVDDSTPNKIVTFASLDADSLIYANITTRTRFVGMQMTVHPGLLLENSAGSTYLFPVDDCLILPESHPNIEMELEPCQPKNYHS
ncbi:MAG: glycosyltransferase [Proteobacteria bacterium]|nr:glycosyltransferase [Pseudomonadota bacterium]MBU1641617.1 glycosyltransferase [Pseudomonadota bacterium]